MSSPSSEQDWAPVRLVGEARTSRWLVICDHASNAVPPSVGGGSLGVAAEDMARHIAYDVGAAGLTLQLAELLGAPAVLSTFSRLVIDPNRGEDDPTLLMKLYDGTLIPANRHADQTEVERRLDLYHRPYHDAVARLAARRADTVLISVHSFTPQFRHRQPRPWHVGLLFASDDRLSRPLLDLLRDEGSLVVGENQPYSGTLEGDTIDRHAIAHGRQNTLLEVRNDLIRDDAGQTEWAERLARLLPLALRRAET
ncbi:N-formylglutamate amidohydrolase [Silicimonas algicola]|uniref:Putative N-formylglutamate amidohydrolase n=1 Tax=Silicimonas algicola TaxID=1826607 RepID=A0A316G2G7_9RHOB|nr:N-formylglutamate amidohydrolase [Silicimonas algicola]AZQ69017.1 N-formylglutamate amidohydrolase [Silicimonas algicola]PWK54096.1 putative N-formylglutamate amidohydrolase [Silicimonas algicola]